MSNDRGMNLIRMVRPKRIDNRTMAERADDAGWGVNHVREDDPRRRQVLTCGYCELRAVRATGTVIEVEGTEDNGWGRTAVFVHRDCYSPPPDEAA